MDKAQREYRDRHWRDQCPDIADTEIEALSALHFEHGPGPMKRGVGVNAFALAIYRAARAQALRDFADAVDTRFGPVLRESDPLSDWSRGVAWTLDRARAVADTKGARDE